MTKLSVLPHESLCPEGVQFDAKPGTSICDALLANGIAIEHACEKSCACTTCHVVVRRGGASLGEATESEEDMLDKAWGLEAQSRLAKTLQSRSRSTPSTMPVSCTHEMD